MKSTLTILALIAAACLMAVAPTGCSDSDSPADGGDPDTTPPGVVSVTALDATHIEVVYDEKVEEILANKEKVKTVTDNAYQMVMTTYNWDHIAKKMEAEVFSKVLKK